MSSPTEAPIEIPPLPVDGRWRGAHLQETRWQLELTRLLVDPVFRGNGVPRGDGRAVMLMPGSIATSEQLTFATNPHMRGRYPNLRSQAPRTRSVWSPPPRPDRLKARDVRRSGWASMCVMGHEPPYPSAALSGPAEILTEHIGMATAAIMQRITRAAEAPEP